MTQTDNVLMLDENKPEIGWQVLMRYIEYSATVTFSCYCVHCVATALDWRLFDVGTKRLRWHTRADYTALKNLAARLRHREQVSDWGWGWLTV